MKTFSIILISLAVSVVFALPATADMVTKDEALTVAKNWVNLIIQKEGNWGDSETASVQEIQEFKLGERTVGYYCRVSPKGNVVISLHKELAPVKAYSEISDLDPASDKRMTGFIKRDMQRTLDKLEKQAGTVELAKSEDVQTITKTDQRDTWEKLEQDVQTFAAGLESGEIALAYQPDTYLLSSNWNQDSPYNQNCPGGDGCSHCPVGCVALAGAQIMRYWAWPPDDFEWVNMPDVLDSNEPSTSPPAQIAAVAELCSIVGDYAGVDYDCCDGSAAWCGDKPGMADMLDAYENHFQYSNDAYFDLRVGNSNDEWFDMIMNNINENRPLQYCTCEFDFPGVAAHSLVLDGWKVVGSTFYGHMNDGLLEWVDMTNLPGAEGAIKNVKPVQSLGNWLSGDPPDDPVQYDVPSFPYRYFDQDATGRNVTFAAGHNLQFLPGVTVRGTSPEGDYIRFVGTPSDNTWFHSVKGTPSGGLDASIRILDGGIRLYNTGSIRFH
jgi:hypothetical protein